MHEIQRLRKRWTSRISHRAGLHGHEPRLWRQSASHHAQAGDSLLTIREQGSFLIGGTVKTQPGTYDTRHPLRADGQTLHGDHAYVSYQIPADARRIPLVFLHVAGQSAKTWESTPDGREGFATLFLRRGFSTYLIDQPRRGRAGRSTADETVKATPDDQFWFENFRMGVWPHYYKAASSPDRQRHWNSSSAK